MYASNHNTLNPLGLYDIVHRIQAHRINSLKFSRGGGKHTPSPLASPK